MLLKWPEIGIELSRPMHSGLTTDASPNRGKQGHARCAGTTACSACGASARVVTTPYTYLSPTPIMGCGGGWAWNSGGRPGAYSAGIP